MKTFFSILCTLSILVLLSACDNGDSGSSGGGGELETVSYEIGTNSVVCYNADDNIIQGTKYTCTWNCATYGGSIATAVTLVFDEDDTGTFGLTEEKVKGTCNL